MTGPEHDAELEAFLKRRSPMYRRLSDIDHAEPSLEIDRLVLNRAREAIETPRQPPMYRTTRWALPVGLAATILIAFTVVLNIDRHSSNAAKPVASSVSPAAEAAARLQAAEPPVARAAPVRASAPAEQPQVLSDSSDARRDVDVAKKAEAPAVLAKRSEAPQRRDAAAKSSAAERSSASDRYLASSNALASNMSVPPPPAATAQAPQAAAQAQAGAAAAAPDPHATAESWLLEIKRLRAAGKTADANRELAAFRQAYPTHPAYSVAKPPAR
jgi:hypothetical protein